MRFHLRAMLYAAVVASLGAFSANAATVKITATGEITAGGAESTFGIGLFSNGDAVTYTAIFDTNTSPSATGVGASSYDQAATEISVSVGGYSATANFGDIFVSTNDDVFAIQSSGSVDGVLGASSGSFDLEEILLYLDYANGLLVSTSLPTSLPDASLLAPPFGGVRLFTFSAGSQDRQVFWAVDSVDITTISAVPIPASALLLLSALAGTAAFRTRKVRRV